MVPVDNYISMYYKNSSHRVSPVECLEEYLCSALQRTPPPSGGPKRGPTTGLCGPFMRNEVLFFHVLFCFLYIKNLLDHFGVKSNILFSPSIMLWTKGVSQQDSLV